MKKTTLKKTHSPMITYRNTIKRITNAYNKTLKNRQEKDGLGRVKKDLRPLSYFTDKVKVPKE